MGTITEFLRQQHRGPFDRPRHVDVPITRLDVSAYLIPTDGPESDGTLEWDHTLMVLVEARGGNLTGLGYTYASYGSAYIVKELLSDIVIGHDALAVEESWWSMLHAVRNIGRPGPAAMAVSAVDAALWDLKARLLNLPLVTLLSSVRDAVPVYGSGGFITYDAARLERQLGGWVAEGIPRVKMKIGRDADQDLRRIATARRAIGDRAELFVDANGAYSTKVALKVAEASADHGVTWFEEPVSSDDLDGLHLLRERMPAFASPTFTEWFGRRRSERRGGIKVILWPDTFNNYFYPGTAKAAVEVLEAAGCRVVIPSRPLCCGRPLYDFGMLDLAKRQLRQILDCLEEDIGAGTPIVGLEPSCVAVFRDELINLFPHDEAAKRLAGQTSTLGEYLKKSNWHPPRLQKKAIMHGHCHQKAVMGFTAEPEVLRQTGLDVKVLDSGCCGMAGSFGFKREHYGVSQRVGDLVVLPAVSRASVDSLIVADGFSCRQQIAQGTNRKALHVAEVLHLALQQDGRSEVHAAFPETDYLARNTLSGPPRRAMPLLIAGAVALGLLTLRHLWRTNHLPGIRREERHGFFTLS